MPELAQRTAQIVARSEPASSIAHAAYSMLELVRLGLLFSLGITALTADQVAQEQP